MKSAWTAAVLVCALGCADNKASSAPCAEGFERGGSGECSPSTGTPTDTGTDTSIPDDTGAEPDTSTPSTDTGPLPSVGIVLPESCGASIPLPTDPIIDRGGVDSALDGGTPMKLVSLSADADRGLLWGVGAGGLQPIDISDPDAPVRLEAIGADEELSALHNVYALSSEDPGHGLVYTTHPSLGLTVFDATDPNSIEVVSQQPGIGLGQMSQDGNRLFITIRSGTVQAFDISDRRHPAPRAAVSGFGTPWGLSATDDALYIADPAEGAILVLDTSDPDGLTHTASVEVPGVVHVDAREDLLAAAAGFNGVYLFDLSNPLSPVQIGHIRYGSSVKSARLDGDRLWLVDHESVRWVDISTPLKAMPAASRGTEQWALDIAIVDGTAWVADWGAVAGFDAQEDAHAPDLRLELDEAYIAQPDELYPVTLMNRGRSTLSLLGAQTELPGLQIGFSSELIGPGGQAQLNLRWDGVAPLDGTICLATDDPDQPTIELDVHTGGGGSNPLVGTVAADFILTQIDVEGTSGDGPVPAWFSKRLQDQRGQPMVLVFFSAEDPMLTAELLEQEHNIWRYFEAAGAKMWGIADDDAAELRDIWQEMKLSFPVFPDPGSDVHITYPMTQALPSTAYPQHWVVDSDGVIVYASNHLNPGALRAAVRSALE